MKKKNKIIIIDILAIACSVLLCIAMLFYFTDPFEGNHNYEIPANPDDIVLCCYKKVPYWDTEFYMITNDGTVKKSRGEWLFSGENSYEKINQDERKGIKIESLTDEQLRNLTKMNANNYWGFDLPSIFPQKAFTIIPPHKIYYIVQKENGRFAIKMIWYIEYNQDGENGHTVYKCRSKYTNDICKYIDYAVDEARKAGL